MPIWDQNTAETISKTVTQAIDAGTIGIAVLLAVGLIIMGVGMGLLVWKVIVPLLKQVIQLTSQVTTMIERTNEAIDHSNETNTLMTQAQHVGVGETQGMRKDIRVMVDGFELLSRNFGAYQVLQSDSAANMVERMTSLEGTMVSFRGEIQQAINNMLESIATNNTFVETIANDVSQAVREHQTIIKNGELIIQRGIEIVTKIDQVIALLPPTPPPAVTNITNVNTNAADKPADSELKDAAA